MSFDMNNTTQFHKFIVGIQAKLSDVAGDFCTDTRIANQEQGKKIWVGYIVAPLVFLADSGLTVAGKIGTIFECVIKGAINILHKGLINKELTGVKQLGTAMVHTAELITVVPAYIFTNFLLGVGFIYLSDSDFAAENFLYKKQCWAEKMYENTNGFTYSYFPNYPTREDV